MNPPYGNQGYFPPPNAWVYGDPNTLQNLKQSMLHLNRIAADQATTANMLVFIAQTLDNIQVHNKLVHEQQEQALFVKEEAFSSIEETTQGLVIYGKARWPHVILPIHIEAVFYVQMHALYRQESFYIIYFINDKKPLILSLKQWNDLELLLDALSSATGHQIHTYVSRKKTGQMLRNHLAARAKVFPIPFFAGWNTNDSGWNYYLINDSTHGNDDTHLAIIKHCSPNGLISEQIPSSSSTLTMLNQIIRFMECITNSELTSILFTWIHAASLYTLLQEEGFTISMGLCLYSSDPRITNSLETLMCWYNDKPISTDLSPEEFAYQIATRKDQPLPLVGSAKHTKNIDFLHSTMSTGQISSNQGHSTRRIQALPTAISNTLGPLCYSPQFILLEITACDMNPSSLAQFDRLRKYLPDYLMAFATYTKNHIAELTSTVEMEIYAVHSNCPADCPMSQNALNTLGILTGIQKFVWDFHRDLAPMNELLEKLRALSPRKPSTLLADALSKSSDYSDTSTAIVSQFCAVASRWITDGQIDLRNLSGERINKSKSQNRGVIYRDSEFHYITRIAFTAICKAVDNSSPSVLHALSEVGILTGSHTNDATFQTRKNINGRSIAVYKLDSTMVDEYSKIEG